MKFLIKVGEKLLKCIRKSDTVARMGGDEFTIILRNIKDKTTAENIVKKNSYYVTSNYIYRR